MGNILAGIVVLILFGMIFYGIASTADLNKQEFNIECYLGNQRIYQSISVGDHKQDLFGDGFYFTDKKTGKQATLHGKCMFIPILMEQR